MYIRTTPHMLLIYGAIISYLVGSIAVAENMLRWLLKWVITHSRSTVANTTNRRIAAVLYFMGFLLTVAAFALRWNSLGHIPLQSMFDIFLAMGMAIYPITLFCRRLGARAEHLDMLIGVILLVPAALVFPDASPKLPPALQSFLFGPHVAAYLLAYIIMTKAAINALYLLVLGGPKPPLVMVSTPRGWISSPIEGRPSLVRRQSYLVSEPLDDSQVGPHPADGVKYLLEGERPVYRLVCLGMPLLTMGLLMGSWWGQLAWGDYWGWDPKEMWSLATWLIFVFYFHVRTAWPTRIKLRSMIVLLGFAAIVCTVLWVNLSRLFPGLHNYAS